MYVVHQADDPFVCFGAKPNKVLSPRSHRDRKWVRERERSWTKEPRGRQLLKGDASGQSTPGSKETSWHEIGSRSVREDRSRWVGIPGSFVEISLEIYASVSLHMHKGMQCYITPLLALKLTQAYWSFVLCSFSPTPLIVFPVAMKKYAMPLSEPLVDHLPRSDMVSKRLMCRAAEVVSSQLYLIHRNCAYTLFRAAWIKAEESAFLNVE